MQVEKINIVQLSTRKKGLALRSLVSDVYRSIKKILLDFVIFAWDSVQAFYEFLWKCAYENNFSNIIKKTTSAEK
jgi:hypothetical protein